MAMNQVLAESYARDLITTMAQSGVLKIAGSTTTREIEVVKKVASRDAEYLTTLYRELVSGFQK